MELCESCTRKGSNSTGSICCGLDPQQSRTNGVWAAALIPRCCRLNSTGAVSRNFLVANVIRGSRQHVTRMWQKGNCSCGISLNHATPVSAFNVFSTTACNTCCVITCRDIYADIITVIHCVFVLSAHRIIIQDCCRPIFNQPTRGTAWSLYIFLFFLNTAASEKYHFKRVSYNKSAQSRPRRHPRWQIHSQPPCTIVQPYLPCGANAYAHLIHDSLLHDSDRAVDSGFN